MSAEDTAPPRSAEKIWQFVFDPTGPKADAHRFTTNRVEGPSNIYGMPVFPANRLDVAGGGDLFWGKNEAFLQCIDATKTGDITRDGPVWSDPKQKHVFGTPVLHEGLIHLADYGRLFCGVDAAKGRAVWTHAINGEVGLGTRSGAC